MTETLPVTTVGLRDEQELIAAIRRYKGLRTYPQAHDASQRALHQTCMGLLAKGLVQGREAGSVWLWSVS